MSTCTMCGEPIVESERAPARCCSRAAADGCCSSPRANTSAKLGGTGFRLGVGILVVGQSMIFGLALNLHDDVPAQARELVQWLILAGTALVAVLLGGPLVRAAWTELRRHRLTIEALFLLTMTGALAASLQAHITGRGKIYFEVVSVLLVVYTIGKMIGARTRAAALANARAWGDQLCVCRLVDETGRTRIAPVVDVRPGDVVEVYPGEMIAVDGVIRAGVGFVSESAVSGESFAVVRRPGDRVLAGSGSFDATFRIAATVKGTDREVDRLLAVVEAARDKPLSLQARADAIGRWFLPLVVFTALGTFTFWAAAEGWETGLFNAMSVLLVACPCVIGLATPVVVWSALARLAERGVIVRSGDAIEKLATVDCVMLDKTGTLTEDRYALVDIQTAEGADRARLLGWLSLVQSQSNHPIAKPFAELPRTVVPGEEPRVVSLVTVPGCGVIAHLQEARGARHEMKVGTSEWLLPLTSPLEGEVAAESSRRRVGGMPLGASRIGSPPGSQSLATSPSRGEVKKVCVALDGELVATATVAERLRDSAPQALEHFAQLGLWVEVLTGDASGRAEALGLPSARCGLLPDEKHAAVEDAIASGARPLFVGDGINDASALAAAHVGVALASGTELAISAAPITLHTNDLRALPWAIELSRGAVRAVRRNLYRALCYNLAGMTLAACGVLHPVVAALLMVVSSLSLLFSSTRVGERAKRPPPQPPPCREGEQELRSSIASDNAQEATPQFTPSLQGGGWGGGLALAHAIAFALQGLVVLLLLAPLREPIIAAIAVASFAIVGCAFAVAWRRFTVPHWADMCFGMLTLGNLGMLLGWWIDNDFAALACAKCACAELQKPWMWIGMLVFANVAMKWLGRSAPAGCHALAMFTGGNVGMVLGMIAGGWCAAQLALMDVTVAVGASFFAMTVGMLAGMLAGTWFAERAFARCRVWFTSARTA